MNKPNAKKVLLIGALLATLLFWNVRRSTAQRTAAPAYDYAIVKWDGPDGLFYNLPNKSEQAHIEKGDTRTPRDAQQEEWCLAYAANQMAKEGWEPVNLDSRRILFRRAR